MAKKSAPRNRRDMTARSEVNETLSSIITFPIKCVKKDVFSYQCRNVLNTDDDVAGVTS